MINTTKDTRAETVFLTGATGLLGSGTLLRLLRNDPALRAVVLVRRPERWRALAARLRLPGDRVTSVTGDVRARGLGLPPDVRRQLAGKVTGVLHLAADVVFSRTLEEARATNVEGTRHLLELADAWPSLRRFVHVSTAFVAGNSTGFVPEEGQLSPVPGWANAYERSKWEAERLVAAARADRVILRPSSVVFDLSRGIVPQFNAVHGALRLFHHGLVPMLPGTPESPIDLVSSDWVADGIARLARAPSVEGRTYHLCAGAGALPLGELLERTWALWSEDPLWRRRGTPQPVLVDLDTYALFQRSVEETGDEGLRRAARKLSYFSPHLALAKRFDTAAAEAALGGPAPAVVTYWRPLLDHLEAIGWKFQPMDAAA